MTKCKKKKKDLLSFKYSP